MAGVVDSRVERPRSESMAGHAEIETHDEHTALLDAFGTSSSDEDGNNYDDDDDSDSESILLDILNAEEDDASFEATDHDHCTLEETVHYKARLQELGVSDFIKATLTAGIITAKKLCTAFGVRPPAFWEGRPDSSYFRLLGLVLLRESSYRKKLPQFNNIDDAVSLLQRCKNIMVITGAGISTNLGIPDFRSKDTGFYAQLKEQGFDDPQQVFDINLFDEDPSIFYTFAGQTFPDVGRSTPTHAFIRLLQDKGKLLTNYTQNIDNIEGNAGIRPDKLIQCHGSWATATCRKCSYQVAGHELLKDLRANRVTKCERCVQTLRDDRSSLKRKRSANLTSKSKPRKDFEDDSDDDGRYDIPEPGVMKPDITFFGEQLPSAFFDRFRQHDREIVDLIVVIGTSMKVAPVADIPLVVAADVPQIYISLDSVKHIDFDIVLRGDCDIVVAELAKRAGWDLQHPMLPATREVDITADNQEKGIWLVKEKIATAQAPTSAHVGGVDL